MKRFFILLMVLLLQVSCATVENNFDPLEGMNRKVDGFNTIVDEVTLRPISQGYTKVIPDGMRSSVTNFFENLQEPNTIINDVLQGKALQSLSDIARFVVNSTVGLAGLFDVASHMGLEKHKEDFGQTLATWGVGQGAYVVVPILGPDSVRNLPATWMSYQQDLFVANYISALLSPEAAFATMALKFINERANIEEFVQMRDEMALDAYVFVREGWRQSREYRIYDGHPPAKPKPEEDDDFEDEFADEFD